MSTLQVVVGGQYGSEAKGAVCGHLLRENRLAGTPISRVLGVRVGGPNAGHTIWSYNDDGTPKFEFKLRHIPVAAVADPTAHLALAAGSEVNLDVLYDEVMLLDGEGVLNGRKIVVDPSATLLDPEVHIPMESGGKLTDRIGSTGKGIGAARSERIWRRAQTVGQAAVDSNVRHPVWEYIELADVSEAAMRVLGDRHGLVQIEGVQGYGLGLHGEHYPHATSSDCRAIDFLAMAGVNPWALQEWDELEIWVVARTHPIRVAGNSGPMRYETSWEQLGLPQERTTVTNKIRRVGEWDLDLVSAAIQANGDRYTGVIHLAITMLDQLFPDDAGENDRNELTGEAQDWINQISKDLSKRVELVTTSPHTAIWLP